MFILFELFCGTPPSCFKVVGWWWLGGLYDFSVSPRPLRTKLVSVNYDFAANFYNLASKFLQLTFNKMLTISRLIVTKINNLAT